MTTWSREVTAATSEREGTTGAMAGGCSVVIERRLGTVVVTLHGALTAASSAHVAAVLHDLVEGQGNLGLAVDLRALRGIDATGVDVLSAAAASLDRRGGALRLWRPASDVLEALGAARLARLVAEPEDQRATAPAPGTTTRPPAGWTAAHPAGSGAAWRPGRRYG